MNRVFANISKQTQHIVRIFCAVVVAVALGACGRGDSAPGDRERTVREGAVFVDKEVRQEGGFFYRLQATYTVVETEEVIDFDIVVGCDIRVTSYSYTGSSFAAKRSPEFYVKPTTNGGALMIKAPNVCQQGVLDRVPDDYTPFAIWFDDVNDLSFGWGYGTQGAYERENSKLSFTPGSLSRASYEDWRAWRERAVAEYEQVGALPGPWGYSTEVWGEAGKRERDRVIALNGGRWLATGCSSVSYTPLLAEEMALIEEAAAKDPNTQIIGDYIVAPVGGEVQHAWKDAFSRFADAPRNFNGYLAPRLRENSIGTILKPPARGWYTRYQKSNVTTGYYELYPVVTYSDPPPRSYKESGTVRQVLTGPEWTGLAACGTKSRFAPEDPDEAAPFLSRDQAAGKGGRNWVYYNQERFFDDAANVCSGSICVPILYSRRGYRLGRDFSVD